MSTSNYTPNEHPTELTPSGRSIYCVADIHVTFGGDIDKILAMEERATAGIDPEGVWSEAIEKAKESQTTNLGNSEATDGRPQDQGNS